MNKIILGLIVVVGALAGGGTGIFLRPEVAADVECDTSGHEPDCVEDSEHGNAKATEPDLASVQYVKLSKQFVVPVVKENEVSSLVVLSLSVETTPALSDKIFEREPKLRDAFLRVMFLHANSGGFDGQFTGSEAMRDLRGSLLEVAREIVGPDVYSILVTDILRQDV